MRASRAHDRMTSLAPAYRRHAAWVPFALLVALLLASFVAGRGLVPASGAATVDVTGSVDADIFLDGTNCTAAAVVIGDLVPGIDPWKTAQDQGGQTCALDFGTTNHSPGTTLSMLEDPAAPAAPADAMKCVAAVCAGDSIADFENTGAEPAAGTSAFGAQLLSTGGIAAGEWNTAPGVYDIQDAASAACSTAAIGTGTCAFTWGATAATSDAPGAYQAQARLVVFAN